MFSSCSKPSLWNRFSKKIKHHRRKDTCHLVQKVPKWGFDSVHDRTRFKNKCTNCTLPCGLFFTYRRNNRINFTCIIICTYIIGLATFILLYMASITLQPTCIMAHATVYWPHKLNSHWLNVHGRLHHFLPRELLHLAWDLLGTNSHNMDCVTLN